MKTKHVIGKKIARIDQRKFWSIRNRRMEVEVVAIVLEDGTELLPIAHEQENDSPSVEVLVYRA